MSRTSRFVLGTLTGVAAATLAIMALRRQQQLRKVGGSERPKSSETEMADESSGDGSVRDIPRPSTAELPIGPSSTTVASHDLALTEDADIGSTVGDPSPSTLLPTESEATSLATADTEPLPSTRYMESNCKEVPNGASETKVLVVHSDSIDAQNSILVDASHALREDAAPQLVATATDAEWKPTAIVVEPSVISETVSPSSLNSEPLKDDTNHEIEEQEDGGNGDDGETSPKRRRSKKKKQQQQPHSENLDSSTLLDSSVDYSESGDFVDVAPGDASPTDVSAILKARTKKVRSHHQKSGAAAVAVKELHSSNVETKKKKKNKNKNF